MGQLACSVCGEKYQVSPWVDKVTCTECYITGEAPRVEDGVYYYSPEAFKKIVSAGIDDWELIEDKRIKVRKLVKRFNRMRKRESSLVKIKQKLDISWRKTKRLEAYRLFDLGYKRKDIAKELGVNLSTISRWKVLYKELKSDQIPCRKGKMQHSNSESCSGSSSSEGKNQENQGHRKSKIDYHFSKRTLNFVLSELENGQTNA